ncbi:DUF948 domain-containing protein [Paenibacillus tarimensis]|uniref:DUF948 domain-containing protein n=1 Tax=Paenibacillus tarimensis TaxID=416012 RepID=UPI001F19AC46|nr:DUF948 domain-containing protein [Paenibacillus tarimensis]MCF2943189.1 DUF948 domain-containing protein [Paenibacillus tarimensis]
MVLIWCAATATAAFLALAAIMLVSLLQLKRKLGRMEEGAAELQRETLLLLKELRQASGSAAETAASVNRQLARADKLFAAVEELGDAAMHAAAAASRITAAIGEKASRQVEQAVNSRQKQIGEALELAELGWAAWTWWRSKNIPTARSPECQTHDVGHDKI